MLPCDAFLLGMAAHCVAAHSTVRALYESYNGPLYQVRRVHDNQKIDIPLLSDVPIADSNVQDVFCQNAHCVIERIYDQSPFGNHLDIAPGGGQDPTPDKGCKADKAQITVGGHKVYGAYFQKGMGYRNNNTTNVAVGDEAETIYMVVSGTHYNNECCFDYGNAETDNLDDGRGTMETIYFGNGHGSYNSGGSGSGPWIMMDSEKGLWGSNVDVPKEHSINHKFVTAMLKGDEGGSPGHWTLKGGDAQSGTLDSIFDGERPQGYAPMKKKGAIVLGIGGDNSDKAVGTFYEGAITRGYSTDEADDAIQASIVAADYDRYDSPWWYWWEPQQ